MTTKLNLLQATVGAIAESDAEIGGTLQTNLSEAHEWGADIGELQTANPTYLISYAKDGNGNTYEPFKSTDVGKGIDILEKATPTGSEGPYIVKTYINGYTVELEGLDGSTPSFTDEKGIRWRFSTLRVDTVWQFKNNDRLQQLYVGTVQKAVQYTEVDATPGAAEFRGLGEYEYSDDGVIDSSLPTTFYSKVPVFTADDVGKGIWILPKDSLTGNEGPRVIASYVDERTVTISGTSFSADETDVKFMVQTLSGEGYLDSVQREDYEVVDGSISFSAIDKLKRSFWLDFAEDEELDFVGRNVAVDRPRIFGDKIYRRYVEGRAYLPAQTIQGINIILEKLFPEGGYTVYEDLKQHPNEVFITIPQELGTDYEGRTFMTAEQDKTSDTATQITLDSGTAINRVKSVRVQDENTDTEMGSLPSADTPAWTYQNEGDTEGNVFSVSGGVLTHAQADSDALGGRYTRDIPELETAYCELSAWWQATTITTVNGRPWHLQIKDGEREFMLEWDNAGNFALVKPAGTVVAGPVSTSAAGSKWHRIRLIRKGNYVTVRVNGKKLMTTLASGFDASSSRQIGFGYVNRSQNQNWTVTWDRVNVRNKGSKNYYNTHGAAGVISGTTDITDASNPWDATAVGKLFRSHASNNENYGLWSVKTFVSAGQLTLEEIVRSGATVETISGDSYVTIKNPWFSLKDVGKDLSIAGSSLGNDGSYPIEERISPYKVRVTNAGGFTSELNLSWSLDVDFVAESGIKWELIDTGTFVSNVITIDEALPNANTKVTVEFTAMPSAQMLENEFVDNEGSGGSAGNVYYPFYVSGTDLAYQEILDEITAAGVIPRFERTY